MAGYVSLSFAVVAISSILLIWHFIGYPLCMGYVHHRFAPTDEPARRATWDVSVIIPTFNEVESIRQRVRNLRQLEYPDHRYEVIFVDSDSTDGTGEVLRECIERCQSPPMSLVEQEDRKGKASAINVGIEHASGEVVLVSDANTDMNPESLTEITAHFDDPKVGAVAGRKRIPEEDLTETGSYQFYRDLEQMKAMGETLVDSTCQFLGEISAWRKGLAEADTTSLAEDLDLSIQIRKQGYKIAYEPGAVAMESEPENRKEQITANKRRTIGVIQSVWKHWRFLALPVDFYRGLIFPSRKLLQLFSPILFLSLVCGYLYLLLHDVTLAVYASIGVFTAGTTSFLGLLRVKSTVVTDGDASLLSPETAANVFSFLLTMEYMIALSWKEYLLGDYSVIWKKTTSDRVNRTKAENKH